MKSEGIKELQEALLQVHSPARTAAITQQFTFFTSETLTELKCLPSSEIMELFFHSALRGVEREVHNDKEKLRNTRRKQGVFVKASPLRPWLDLMTLLLKIKSDGIYGKDNNCSMSKAAEYALHMKSILGCTTVKPSSAEFLTAKRSILQKYRAHNNKFILTEHGIINLYDVVKKDRKGKQIKKLIQA